MDEIKKICLLSLSLEHWFMLAKEHRVKLQES